MYSRSKQELVPRNGQTLVTGIVARISGCANQKEVSLEDQEDHGKEIVAELYPQSKAVEYRVIATKGKGERLDRPELAQIEEMLRTGELDLLILEDVGRLIRGGEAARLCGVAVDHGVRVISPNDCIDTAEDTWEEDVLAACKEHVGHNAHTSRRLKHKLMNRFKKYGGATALVPPGYVKPPGAKTYHDWFKDDSLTEKIWYGLQILEETLNCSAVADWFNKNGMPLGKYARTKKWDGQGVRQFYSNPILKGLPRRGLRHTIKHNESGRRISVRNPKGPLYRECPHLAHLDSTLLDDVNSRLAEKNKRLGRKPVNGADPRCRVPRKRTRFPGQLATCWYCGRQFVWGGNGRKHALMCSGARQWACWNSIAFDGRLAAEKMVEAITNELYKLDGFSEQFAEIVRAARNGKTSDFADRRRLEEEESSLRQKRDNLVAAISEFGPRPMFSGTLAEIDQQEKHLAWERHRLDSVRLDNLELPESVEELRELLKEHFQQLAVNSYEFNDFVRPLLPEFTVYLVRLCDGGHPEARAKVRLNLGGSISDVYRVPGLESLLTRELTLDLFMPPQRERIREEVVRLTATGMPQRCIAQSLAETATLPAVQNAIALHREMQELRLESPYVVLLEPPDDYRKLRRHKNGKFEFAMRQGYERPVI
jgi:site-specific DNA recombinase